MGIFPSCPTDIRRYIRYNNTIALKSALEQAGDSAAKQINEDDSPDCVLDVLLCQKANGNAMYFCALRPHPLGPRNECFQILLDHGGDPNSTGKGGDSLIHAAAPVNNLDLIRLCVKAGVDPRQTDDFGRTTLHAAANTLFNTSEVVRYLLSVMKPEDVDTRDFSGCTPLHVAANKGNEMVCITLLEVGADPNAQTKQGNTPLHMSKRWPTIWRILAEAGADVSIKNGRGQTADEMPRAGESHMIIK